MMKEIHSVVAEKAIQSKIKLNCVQ